MNQIIDFKQERTNRFLNYDNPLDGFTNAVKNNQVLLALEHAVLMFSTLEGTNKSQSSEENSEESLAVQLEMVKQEIEDMKASLAPSRKTSKSPAKTPPPQQEDAPSPQEG